MAIVLDFKEFTYKTGTGKGAINSPEEMYDICTPPQLNQFAESILGHRFKKGTKKMPACEELFEAMLEGEDGKNETFPDDESTPAKKTKQSAKSGAKKPSPAKNEAKKPVTKKKETKEREALQYVIKKGKALPEKYQVTSNREIGVTNIPKAIVKACNNLLGRKKAVEATIDELMDEARTTTEWAEKPSKMDNHGRFAWWAKLLRETGWVTRQES